MDKQFSSVMILRETIRKKNEQLKRDYEIDKSGKYVVRGTRILKRGGVFNDIVLIPKVEKTAQELQAYSIDDYELYID